jgi:hypothetical protein
MFQLINNQREAKIIPEEPSITSSLYNELQKKKSTSEETQEFSCYRASAGQVFL